MLKIVMVSVFCGLFLASASTLPQFFDTEARAQACPNGVCPPR